MRSLTTPTYAVRVLNAVSDTVITRAHDGVQIVARLTYKRRHATQTRDLRVQTFPPCFQGGGLRAPRGTLSDAAAALARGKRPASWSRAARGCMIGSYGYTLI